MGFRIIKWHAGGLTLHPSSFLFTFSHLSSLFMAHLTLTRFSSVSSLPLNHWEGTRNTSLFFSRNPTTGKLLSMQSSHKGKATGNESHTVSCFSIFIFHLCSALLWQARDSWELIHFLKGNVISTSQHILTSLYLSVPVMSVLLWLAGEAYRSLTWQKRMLGYTSARRTVATWPARSRQSSRCTVRVKLHENTLIS